MSRTIGLVCAHHRTHVGPRGIASWLWDLRLALLLTAATALFAGCADGDGGGGMPPPVVGGTATLTWNPVQGDNVSGYVVHYGPASPNSGGSCSYDSTLFVSSPEATVTGLAYDTTYYFAVSAYNGAESACSEEVAKHVSSVA